MNLKSFRPHTLIYTLLLALVMMCAFPSDSYARKKSSKARTSQTSTKKTKKSKKSKSSSSKSKKKTRKSSSKSGSSAKKARASYSRSSRYAGNAASDSEMERIAARYAASTSAADPQTPASGTARSTDSKRKVKVEKPDLKEIRRITLDPSSPFYFPKLKKKYETNDTTMTPEEFRNFYLGYMFQEDFDPYRVSPYSNVTDDLRNKPTHTREEIDTITKYAILSLEDNPFDLRQMSFLVHVLKERRKDMRAKIWEYRLENLLGAIKSTGTGDSSDNAWYVIYPVHEYDMVQLLGYEAVDAKFIDPGYDYLEVQPDESDTRKRDKSAKGFYFNVMVPQQQYELKHPEEFLVSESDPEVEPEPVVVKEELEEIDPDDLPAE